MPLLPFLGRKEQTTANKHCTTHRPQNYSTDCQDQCAGYSLVLRLHVVTEAGFKLWCLEGPKTWTSNNTS